MLTLIRGGKRYSLDDGSIAYLLAYDGWGMPPTHRLQTRGPLQHGEFDLGFRLDPRIGRIVLAIKGNSRNDMLIKSEALIRLFKPADDTLSLEWQYGDIIRLIDVIAIGDMTMPSSDQSGFTQKIVITLNASDPTFYGPSDKTVIFSSGVGEYLCVIPMEVPTYVGTNVLDQSEIINYGGSWDSYPYIRIVGPITDCVIRNSTTGDKLDFSGKTIAPGGYYDIDTRYGFKTVKDDQGANRIMDLNSDSDLATFRLVAKSYSLDGINNIHITGTSSSNQTQVIFGFRERYLSM